MLKFLKPPARFPERTPLRKRFVEETNSSAKPNAKNTERVAQFVELYSQYYPRLQYYLMSLVPTPGDAADVIQETSLVLWEKFDTFELGTNFFAWACKIARLQTLKHYQTSSRAAKLFDLSTLEILAEEAMEHAEKPVLPLEILDSCLERLSEADRILIRRRYEPDTTVNQIASELGVTANYLSKLFGRIRRLLLACVQGKLAQE